MAKLTEDQQTMIVRELAMFTPRVKIRDKLRESFGIDVPHNQIEGYDPDSHRGRTGHVARKWIALHESIRSHYLEDASKIPILSQNYRLRRLNEMEQEARAAGNHVFAAALLEQAAKEAGDMFTNRRRVDHRGIIESKVTHTPDELALMLADRLRSAFEARNVTHHVG